MKSAYICILDFRYNTIYRSFGVQWKWNYRTGSC